MIDTHYHLDQLDKESLHRMLVEASEGGIETIIAPAMGLESGRKLLDIQSRYPNFIRVGLGIHPERSDFFGGDQRNRERLFQEQRELANLVSIYRNQICAVGEIGLPYYSMPEKERLPENVPALSWQIFEESLALAKDWDLPVILHAVHSMARPCLELLLQFNIKKAVFHWLKAPLDAVDKIVFHGYYISFTPEAVYRERNQILASRVPLDQILLETDGPWPYEGPFAGKKTHSLWIREVADVVAHIHKKPIDQVLAYTADNARKLFRV
ncbi:TatD family hydrolase [Effusibacillus consociatus]|uniref:TatD family hydrolase n=1 Tax=Effusibacillus consociatus TaxID=1117041 RepID=A0ABV9Q5V1_9BACL